jgi:hypothetical protein
MEIIKAHNHSIRHYNELKQSDLCGCFYCCKTFKFSQITDWVKDSEEEAEQTALCPFCGIDSIIGSKSGYPIEKKFLKQMKKKWF